MSTIREICAGICFWHCRPPSTQNTADSQESQQRLISTANGALANGKASLGSTKSEGSSSASQRILQKDVKLMKPQAPANTDEIDPKT